MVSHHKPVFLPGLAFLLLQRGDISGAAYHLDAFLIDAPKSPEATRWVTHARETLESLRTTNGEDMQAIDGELEGSIGGEMEMDQPPEEGN